MIKEVLTVLKNELQNAGLSDVVVNDIAKHEDGAAGLDNKVVITLLNIQEESTMKNMSRYIKNTSDVMKMESPSAYVNLFVMITANRTDYDSALINISKVIETLRAKNVLEYVATGIGESNFTFRTEMHAVPFEQLSYIWGLLGGKIIPSVMYKVSVVKIGAKNVSDVQLINDVEIKDITVK